MPLCYLLTFFKINFFFQNFFPLWKFKEQFKKNSFIIQEQDSKTGQEHLMNIKLDNFLEQSADYKRHHLHIIVIYYILRRKSLVSIYVFS